MKKVIYTTPTLRTYTINVASVLMQSATGNASGADITSEEISDSDFNSIFGL